MAGCINDPEISISKRSRIFRIFSKSSKKKRLGIKVTQDWVCHYYSPLDWWESIPIIHQIQIPNSYKSRNFLKMVRKPVCGSWPVSRPFEKVADSYLSPHSGHTWQEFNWICIPERSSIGKYYLLITIRLQIIF